MVHMEYYLVVSTFMMFAGIYGFFTRRNLLAMLISVELILNSVDINFAVFNRYLFPEELEGFFFALFAIGVSAAETAVAIAIIINIYRNVRNIQVKNLNEMKTNYGTYNTNPYPTFPQFPDTGAGRYAYEERIGRDHRHRFTGRGDVAFLPHCLQLFAGGRTAEGVYPTLTPYNFEWLPFTTNLHIDMGIMLDPISVMMLVVISTVSLMVHIYSFGYMKGEKAFNVTTHFLACLPCPCWGS